jgi:hypothetical protein
MAAPVQNMRLSLNEEGLFAQVKPVTDACTVRQLLYVFLLQGSGASAVCFGINFGVAVLVVCQKESVRPSKFLQFDPFGPGETHHTSK